MTEMRSEFRKQRHLLICGAVDGELDLIERLRAQNVCVVPCHTPAALASKARDGTVGLVIDVEALGVWSNNFAAPAIIESVPLVLRASLTRAAARTIVEIALQGLKAIVSLRHHDDLFRDSLRIVELEQPPTPELRMLELLAVRGHGHVPLEYVTGVLGGRRRGPVSDIASLAGMKIRTLEDHFARLGKGTPAALAGSSLGLTIIYQMEALNWTAKAAAIAAGYEDPNDLAEFVERHLGARPRALIESRGFTALAQDWAGEWAAE